MYPWNIVILVVINNYCRIVIKSPTLPVFVCAVYGLNILIIKKKSFLSESDLLCHLESVDL